MINRKVDQAPRIHPQKPDERNERNHRMMLKLLIFAELKQGPRIHLPEPNRMPREKLRSDPKTIEAAREPNSHSSSPTSRRETNSWRGEPKSPRRKPSPRSRSPRYENTSIVPLYDLEKIKELLTDPNSAQDYTLARVHVPRTGYTIYGVPIDKERASLLLDIPVESLCYLIPERDIIYDTSSCRNTALKGDITLTKLMPKDRWISKRSPSTKRNDDDSTPSSFMQATGKVVGLVSIKNSKFICKYQPPRKNSPSPSSCFVPLEKSVPSISVPNTSSFELVKNHLYIVSISHWITTINPVGKIEEHLGDGKDTITGSKVVLFNHGVDDTEFDDVIVDDVTKSIQAIQKQPRSADRLDCSHLRVVSIDPVTAKDLDDALSVELLDNDTARVGIHIADVTHYLAPGVSHG
ncbi:hypothetical protein GEMRC1_002777 [Eukaryota sp. GEM-RC1]